MRRLTDPDFVYVPSHLTNLRATFARIRSEMAAERGQAGIPYWFRATDDAASDSAERWRDFDLRR